jgi:hypothetical protein
MSLTISLTPLEVEQRLASLGIVCPFTPGEHTTYATTPVVSWTRRVLGFPTPAENEFLTLNNIKGCVGTDPKHQPAFFDHPWYQPEEFMTKPCVPGWHFLTMDPIPGSVQQPLNYLRSSAGERLELPQAVEVVLMLFLHYVGTGEQLLSRKHSWCADVASMSRFVTVGAFGRNGVFLSGHPPNFSSQGLGVCAKIVTP